MPDMSPNTRFHALDGLRAAAMIAGVFYHLPISFLQGGFGMGFPGGGSPKIPVDEWLHSFRMPLFFLLSGFFADMMLSKYGLSRYLRRRWWRIGAPLALSLLLLAGYRAASAPAAAGTPPMPAGPGPIAFGQPPPPGFPPGPAPPGFNPRGGGGQAAAFPPAQAGGIAAPPFAIPRPSRPMADLLFGKAAGLFALEHLWFLWYLLIFVTIAPFITGAIDRLASTCGPERFGKWGRWLLDTNLAAVACGLVTLPALLHARSPTGWSLTVPAGFFWTFPDCLVRYGNDQPYYFMYFLVGWWLYRCRDGLTALTHRWLWNLAFGVAGFAISQQLAASFAALPGTPGQGWVRLGGFAIYGIGAAFSAAAAIGFFQRYLDRPTPACRYLADAALWIYLVHLPLIPYAMWWVQASRGAWWSASLAGMMLVTALSLVAYELLIRHTPLAAIFGPVSADRRSITSPVARPGDKPD